MGFRPYGVSLSSVYYPIFLTVSLTPTPCSVHDSIVLLGLLAETLALHSEDGCHGEEADQATVTQGPRTFWSEVTKIDPAGLPREVLRNTRDLYGKRQVSVSGRPPIDLPRTNLSFRGHTLSLPSTVPYTTLALASKADVDETLNPYQFDPESRTATDQLRMYAGSLNAGFPGMGSGFARMGGPWGLNDGFGLHVGGV